ncbi:MAG: hypothetical protein KDE20_10535 [Caldilineaceae bacterium]|nr:hypothetical protein [Caldilineaceae bacterium]
MLTTTVTISDVRLTLDELIASIRRFDPETRAQVLDALLTDEIDARLSALIERLSERPPADDVTDAEIDAEIHAVRRGAPPT